MTQRGGSGGAGARRRPTEFARTIPRPALHPIALAFVAAVHLVMGSGVHVGAGVRLVVVSVVVALVVTLVATLAMGDRQRGGVLGFALVALVAAGPPGPVTLAILLAVAALVVERRAGVGSPVGPRHWAQLDRAFRYVGVVLVLALGLKGVMDGDLARFAGEVAPSRPAVAGAAPADAPDIYVLLLDGHLRPNKVREMTGVDGSAFAVELRERGFDVAEASRSNYVFTIQSVPSFLSGAYLDDLLASDPAGESYADGRRWARERVDGAAIVADLRALGYEIVSIPSEFEETSLRTADRVLEAGQVNELELLAFGNTLAGPLVEAIRPSFFSDQHRDRIRAQVELVAGVAAEPAERPRFVWVHVPSPHAPLVFAADGSPLPPTPLDGFFDDTAESTGLDRAEFGRRYAEQQAHVDELALAAIDAILAASDEPPVILAISDHGSRSSLVVGDVERADPDELTANLVASLTPGHPGLVPDPVTLVNVLGPVVDAYLGTSHPVQPDRILLPDPGFPDFREIPNPDREATPAPVGLGRPPVSPPVSADAPVGLP